MPLCRFHIAGSCKYGAVCSFRHQQAPCSYFAAGYCRKGQYCGFVHERGGRNVQAKAVSSKNCEKPSENEFRFSRIPSTRDNLSHKFRFSVPSPSPYEDQIFDSSDSDWDVEDPKERLESCTLSLYTCISCKEKVLGQEGEEKEECPECKIKHVPQEVEEDILEKEDSDKPMPEIKIKAKKKKRRKKKSRFSGATPSVVEPDVYQTPEGVRVYRAKEELLKLQDCQDEMKIYEDKQLVDDNLYLSSVDPGCDEDTNQFLNMKNNHSSPTSFFGKYLTCSDKTYSPNFRPSKFAPVTPKPRNKAQRRRVKRLSRKQESPLSKSKHFMERDNFFLDSLLSLSMSSFGMIQASFNYCLLIVIWIVNLLMKLVRLSLASCVIIPKAVCVLIAKQHEAMEENAEYDSSNKSVDEEEMVEVANDWKVYPSDYLLTNKEYFEGKYSIQGDVVLAVIQNFRSEGMGEGTRRRRIGCR